MSANNQSAPMVASSRRHTTSVPSGPVADPAVRRPPRLARILSHSALWVTVIDGALLLFFGATTHGSSFLSSSNLQFLGLAAAESIVLAVGIAIVLGAGEIDVSGGANLVLSSVVAAKVMLSQGVNGGTNAIVLGLVSCLVAGLAFGFINGLIVVYLHVNTFITTLATMGIGGGIAIVVAKQGDLSGLPPQLTNDFGIARLGGIPSPLIVALLVALVAWILMGRFRFGLRVLAMGSSVSAASRLGISRARYLISALCLNGLLAGIAGFIDIARFGTTNVGGHATDSLTAVSSAIIGGTALFGGVISVWGAVSGACLSVILLAGLVTMGLNAAYQQVVTGLILVAAVSLDYFRKTKARGGHS